jgi:hypothetical protein
LNLGVSRNRFCDFLADPDSRSFSRFGAIIMQFAVAHSHSLLNNQLRTLLSPSPLMHTVADPLRTFLQKLN